MAFIFKSQLILLTQGKVDFHNFFYGIPIIITLIKAKLIFITFMIEFQLNLTYLK